MMLGNSTGGFGLGVLKLGRTHAVICERGSEAGRAKALNSTSDPKPERAINISGK